LIRVHEGQENSIKIHSEISIMNSSDETKSLMDRVDVEVVQIGKSIQLETKISQKSSSAFGQFFEKNNPLNKESSQVMVVYDLFLPKGMKLMIDGQFTDVVNADWKGDLNLKASHGDFDLGGSLTKLNIDLKYGSLKLHNQNKGSIKLKQIDASISSSSDLILESKESTLNLSDLKDLQINSNKDRLDLGQIENLSGQVDFGTGSIIEPRGKLRLNMNTTEIDLSEIASSYVEIQEKNSTVNFDTSNWFMDLDITIEEGQVRLPKDFMNINSKMIDKSSKHREITAQNHENPTNQLIIKGEKGILNFIK
ncbi:MAG: hypothetical protein ACPGR7_02905, partial [Flavobacteriaceae bacterium]